MNKKILYLVLFVFVQFSFSQIVINEIDADNPGQNDKQFVEIKTVAPNTSLDGYVLVFFNATSSGTGNASYLAIDLDGYTTDINGNFLVGNVSVSPSPLLNIANTIIQTGPDVIALYSGNATDFPTNTPATAANLQSAVAYSTSATASATTIMGILNIPVSYVDVQPLNSISKSIQRKLDGTYEVQPPTPGANNDGSGIQINYLTTSITADNFIEGQNINITFSTTFNVTSDLNFTFTLTEGSFSNLDFSGDTNITIAAGTNSVTRTITLTDDIINEGDEETHLVLSTIPSGYVKNNDNIYIRIYDNDYIVQPFGTPLNPTYNTVFPSENLATYYASLEGLSGNALKQALQDIIANPSVVRLHSYADMWDIIRVADTNPANSNQIWDMYLEVPMAKIDQQQGSSIVGKWNREHIFPQSRGGFSVAEGDSAEGINVWLPTSAASTVDGVSDAHHIRAENGQENSSRNNKNYGSTNSGTVYAGPSGTLGSWRGDVARSLFYMAVRFNGLNIVNGDPSELSGSNASGNIGDLTTLLAWNTSDPRDDFEMNRNNFVQTWQYNRNPFIDYPLLADYIFGSQFGNPWFASLSTDNFSDNTVKVYPNPASDYIFISDLKEESLISIYSISGKKVYESKATLHQNVPVDFETGMYFVKIISENYNTIKKIIVK